MLRNRLPASRPVAVTQKFLVVTCNYPARAAGVGKLMATSEALRRCPELKLVSGEDLTPYREASDAVLEVLSRFGPTQRAGLDEFFVDATAAARGEVEAGSGERWAPGTHVHTAATATTTAEAMAGTGTCFRPMDLRAAGGAAPGLKEGEAAAEAGAAAGGVESAAGGVSAACAVASEGGAAAAAGAGVGAAVTEPAPALLLAASAIASSARAAVLSATGLTSSVGIGHNKLTAKLAASLHKPDAQTALPPSEVLAFLAPLSLRVLPGIGARAAGALAALGLNTVGEARAAFGLNTAGGPLAAVGLNTVGEARAALARSKPTVAEWPGAGRPPTSADSSVLSPLKERALPASSTGSPNAQAGAQPLAPAGRLPSRSCIVHRPTGMSDVQTTAGDGRGAPSLLPKPTSLLPSAPSFPPAGRLPSRFCIVQALCPAAASRLAAQCEGQCSDPVTQQKPPQSLTVEDSFRGCTDHAALALVASVLAPDMERRLAAERAARGRKATNLVVRWRHHGSRTMNNPTGWAAEAIPRGALVASRSVPMPEGGAAAIARAAEGVLRAHVKPPFRLTLLALTATKFVRAHGSAAAPGWAQAGMAQAGRAQAGREGGQAGAGGAEASGAQEVSAQGTKAEAGRVEAGRAEAARHCAFRANYGAGGIPSGGTVGMRGLPQGACGGGTGGTAMRLMSKQEERAMREAANGVGEAAGDAGCLEEQETGGGLFHHWREEEDGGFIYGDGSEDFIYGDGREEDEASPRVAASHFGCVDGQSLGQSLGDVGVRATRTDVRSGSARGDAWTGSNGDAWAGSNERVFGDVSDASEADRFVVADRLAVPELATAAATVAAAAEGGAPAGQIDHCSRDDEGKERWGAATYLQKPAAHAGPPIRALTASASSEPSRPLALVVARPACEQTCPATCEQTCPAACEQTCPATLPPHSAAQGAPRFEHEAGRETQGAPRIDVSSLVRPGSPGLPPWPCAACTFVNAGPMRVCEICETPRAGGMGAAGGADGATGCGSVTRAESDGVYRGGRDLVGGCVGGGVHGGARAGGKRAAQSLARNGASAPRSKRSAGHGAVAAPIGRARSAVADGARPRAGSGGVGRQATLQRFLGAKGES
jgi:nucleotidyltransferase/DNA polymerase involved in DNA repair